MNIPSILAARNPVVLNNYMRQLMAMIPGVESKYFKESAEAHFPMLSAKMTEFEGIDSSQPSTVAFVRRFSAIESVIPIALPMLPGSFDEIPNQRAMYDLLISHGFDPAHEGMRVGGPTSTGGDTSIVLNNGQILAHSKDADPEVITEIPENKGGVIIARDGTIGLHTKDTIKTDFDPAKHIIALGTSTAFTTPELGDAPAVFDFWNAALEITEDNEYRSSDNSRFGFLAQTPDEMLYFDIHFDSRNLHRFALELAMLEDVEPEKATKPEDIKVALAVRLLLEELALHGTTATIVGLEENTGVEPTIVDPEDAHIYTVFPVEFLLKMQDPFAAWKQQR